MDAVDSALADLERSGIGSGAAEHAGIYVADNAKELHASFRKRPAIVIPYFSQNGAPISNGSDGEYFRIRYLDAAKPKSLVKRTRDLRYAQLPKSGVHVYLPRVEGLDWASWLEDPDKPLIITEGEKKALKATLEGFPTLGLGGVFNWLENGALLPELENIPWRKRDVYLAFDSDAAENPNVQAAEMRLAKALDLDRGANILRVRIPTPRVAKGDKTPKVGLDDLLVQEGGVAKLKELVSQARPMRTMDREVLKLNDSVAWIEKDGMVLDTNSNEWLKKTDFTKGSAFSAIKLAVPKSDGNGVKHVSVADEWLTSPLARRYSDVVFRPSVASEEIADGNTISYNLWKGLDATHGDVTPFLELCGFLFKDLPHEHRDFPIKLFAYKAQNPGIKTPIALVLLGTQGCGKSFFAQIIREAFSPYGMPISSSALVSEFNGWIERALIGTVDEAKPTDLRKGSDTLKQLISEKAQMLRDLYRPARMVNSYTQYILTANDLRVGAYAGDDRRMLVVYCPKKREPAFYDKLHDWFVDGGAKHVLGYLQNYDLKGWKPPQEPPMTDEKYMAYVESLTPVQRLAEEMKTATDNTVKLWLDSAMEWATMAAGDASTARKASDVEAVMGRIQVRPFYSPEELVLIFPAMAASLHGLEKGGFMTAGELSRQLRECGVRKLRNGDDPRGFMHKGRLVQYLVICEPDKWEEPLTQAEFDEAMASFPEYRHIGR